MHDMPAVWNFLGPRTGGRGRREEGEGDWRREGGRWKRVGGKTRPARASVSERGRASAPARTRHSAPLVLQQPPLTSSDSSDTDADSESDIIPRNGDRTASHSPAGLLQLATPSRARKNEKRKAKPPFPSEHRTIQSVDGEQDGQSLLASFLLDAPCITPQAPSRRSPKNALQHGADVYEGHFSEHAQPEQDGLPSMDVLNYLAPQEVICSPADSTSDCGQSCLILNPDHLDGPEPSFSDYDVLSHYARDKRNLIIDSPNPFLTPHIVITPPDHPHDGYWAFVENGVGPQSEPNSLLVPPIVQGSSIVWPPWQERHYNWYTAQIASYALPDLSWSPPALDVAIDERNPLGVFSLTRFEYEIEAAAQERLVMYHVIPSLHRIHFKTTAILASRVASEFRRRWDGPSFTSEFERPFHWTDAAEPLLAYHSRDPSSLILDSTHPCSVPHIVITEAPQEDPWEPLVNNTPSPQDCGFGFYLTVPSTLLEYTNLRPFPSETCEDEAYFASTDQESGGYDSERAYEYESGSDEESPMLLTPPSRLSDLEIEVVLSEEDSFTQAGSPRIELYDNDEDDGLPEFDKWYMDIAQRASLPVPLSC